MILEKEDEMKNKNQYVCFFVYVYFLKEYLDLVVYKYHI